MNKQPYKLVSKSGNHIGYARKSRGQWYIKNNIGVLEDAETIRLTFDPDTSKFETDWMKKLCKDKICTICGEDESEDNKLGKQHLIPHTFIRYFPLDKKKNKQEYIIMICESCTPDFHAFLSGIIKELMEKHNVKIDAATQRLIIVAKKIIDLGDKMPKHERDAYDNYYEKMYGVKPTDEDIKRLASAKKGMRYTNIGDNKDFFEFIVKKHINEKTMNKLIKYFADTFVEELEPVSLPEYWDSFFGKLE